MIWAFVRFYESFPLHNSLQDALTISYNRLRLAKERALNIIFFLELTLQSHSEESDTVEDTGLLTHLTISFQTN